MDDHLLGRARCKHHSSMSGKTDAQATEDCLNSFLRQSQKKKLYRRVV
jgi:hypothetical protein